MRKGDIVALTEVALKTRYPQSNAPTMRAIVLESIDACNLVKVDTQGTFPFMEMKYRYFRREDLIVTERREERSDWVPDEADLEPVLNFD